MSTFPSGYGMSQGVSSPGFFSELMSGMQQASARTQGLNPLMEVVGSQPFGQWNRNAGSTIGNILGSVNVGYQGPHGGFNFAGQDMGNKFAMNKLMAGMLKNQNRNPAKTTDASASMLLNPMKSRMSMPDINMDPLGVMGIPGGSYV